MTDLATQPPRRSVMADLATIPGPGVHTLTDEEYFSGPLAQASLSSTGVRELLVAPAKFRWNQQNPQPPKRTFDVGHAAHQLVLGAGPKLIRITGTGASGPNAWQNNYDKAKVARARKVGAVPLKPADWHAVHAMAEALLRHPHAPKLLSRGEPEKTLVWVDEATGVLCRAKADWLRPDGIVDYKSAADATLASLRKAVWNLGYFVQAAFYLRGFRARFPGVEPFFAWVGQEKDPPYLAQTFQLPEHYLAIGDRRCTQALEIYRDCAEADIWPGYPADDIHEIEPPAWVRDEEY